MMNLLQAAAGQPQQPSPWGFYIMIGLMILVLWLFMWRPEAKRRKQMQAFRDGLKKGDKVGELRLYIGKRLLKTCDICAAEDICKKDFKNVLSEMLKNLFCF